MPCLKHYYVGGPGPSVVDRIASVEKGRTGMTAVSKRNILALLGLAPVSLAAVSVQPENFNRDMSNKSSDEPSPGVAHLRVARYDLEKMAITFERLAHEVRTGGVNVSRFHIGCDAVEDNWLTQTLTIDLEMLHKDEPA
jgi:hypothetical protein